MSFLQGIFGPPSIEQLEAEHDVEKLTATIKENLDTSCAAIAALGRLAAPQAVELLLAVLEDDNVRKTTIEALGEIGDEQAVTSLTPLLADGSNEIQSAAACALGQIGDPQAIPSLIDAVQEGDISKDAAKAIIEISEDPVEHLAPMLQAQDQRVRWAAAEALSEVGPPAAAALIDVLKDEESDALAPAAWALGETEDEQAIKPLISLLDHPDTKVRQVAAVELGRLEATRAAEPLSTALGEDQSEDVRDVMVEAWEAITGESWDEETT